MSEKKMWVRLRRFATDTNVWRDGISQADAYQMLAYMAAFGTKDAVLIFPGLTDIDSPPEVITIDIGTARFSVATATVDLTLPVNKLAEKLFFPFRRSSLLGNGKPLTA